MKLKRLELINFKNLNLVLDFDGQINIVVGKNGQGKTNLLEAIYFLSRLESFRVSDIKEIFPWYKDVEYFKIGGLIEDEETHIIEIEIRNESGLLKKKYLLNNLKTSRYKLLHFFPVFIFLPRDLDLVNGSPKVRRSELDAFIEMIEPDYARIKTRYNNVVLNRNRMLKQIVERNTDAVQLNFWDKQLVELGSFIISKRLGVLEEFRDYLNHSAKTLFPAEFKELNIKYISKLVEDQQQISAELIKQNFIFKLQNGKYKEFAACKTLYGPQRDDFEIHLGRMNIHKAGSRGQQRLVTLLIKFAMFKFFETKKSTRACLLLDDVMSELDDKNKHKLETIISKLNTQVIFTTTTPQEFSKRILSTSKQIIL